MKIFRKGFFNYRIHKWNNINPSSNNKNNFNKDIVYDVIEFTGEL